MTTYCPLTKFCGIKAVLLRALREYDITNQILLLVQLSHRNKTELSGEWLSHLISYFKLTAVANSYFYLSVEFVTLWIQAALLRNFAGQHVILCVAYRSKNNSDFLKLINDSCIPRFHEMENTEFPEYFELNCLKKNRFIFEFIL